MTPPQKARENRTSVINPASTGAGVARQTGFVTLPGSPQPDCLKRHRHLHPSCHSPEPETFLRHCKVPAGAIPTIPTTRQVLPTINNSRSSAFITTASAKAAGGRTTQRIASERRRQPCDWSLTRDVGVVGGALSESLESGEGRCAGPRTGQRLSAAASRACSDALPPREPLNSPPDSRLSSPRFKLNIRKYYKGFLTSLDKGPC